MKLVLLKIKHVIYSFAIQPLNLTIFSSQNVIRELNMY